MAPTSPIKTIEEQPFWSTEWPGGKITQFRYRLTETRNGYRLEVKVASMTDDHYTPVLDNGSRHQAAVKIAELLISERKVINLPRRAGAGTGGKG